MGHVYVERRDGEPARATVHGGGGEKLAYPYFAVIRFNSGLTIARRDALGSGIFLHSWVGGPTAGCVALPEPQLLTLLRWLRPRARPRIEIGTDGEVSRPI